MPYCKNCDEHFPNRKKIQGKIRNLSSRVFCLGCSPFGKNNREDITIIKSEWKTCPRCGQKKKRASEFYKNGGRLQCYCKACTTARLREIKRSFKAECIAYKGGQCERCGYNKCQDALEFHHRNPKGKDFCLSHAKVAHLNHAVKRELDKCMLVCANCHREIAAEIWSANYAKKQIYRGEWPSLV